MRLPTSRAIVKRAGRLGVFAVLLPWLVLTVTNGGLHNHGIRVCCRELSATTSAQFSACRNLALEVDFAPQAERVADVCFACLWQLHSSMSSPAAAVVLTCGAPETFGFIAATPERLLEQRSFDARAPPCA